MKRGLLLLVLGLFALTFTSCYWLEEDDDYYYRDGHHSPDAWVEIVSNTYWSGEIDGRFVSGYGDDVFYTWADCVDLDKESYGGYVELTVFRDGYRPATSYTDAPYGRVIVCD